METLFEGFKLWGPFTLFCVGLLAFGWRVLNRREDKLEALIMHTFGILREEMNSQNQRLKEETNSQNQRLKEETNSQYSSLKEEMNSQNASLKESINRLETRLLAYFEARQADMDKLIRQIDSSAQDLRMKIDELNQSHIRHLEHHIELDRRADKQ